MPAAMGVVQSSSGSDTSVTCAPSPSSVRIADWNASATSASSASQTYCMGTPMRSPLTPPSSDAT